MIIFLYGEDSYRSRQKLNQIKEKFKKSDPSNINLAILDGEKTSLEEIRKTIQAVPFLAKKRLVIIENLLTKNKNKTLLEELANYIKKRKISESTVLVFWEENKPDERTKLFKLLKKPGRAQEFKLLSGYSLSRWIKGEIEKRGGKIERKAIEKLAAYVGNDLWQMSNEIDKLISYQALKPITSENVEVLVKAKLDTNIFNLIDAIGEKNRKGALKLLQDQIESGAHPLYLLTMIIYQFRNLLIIKDLIEQGLNQYQIQKETKIHPFVVQKTFSQARNFSLNELKKIYQKLLETDIALKTSKIEPNLALDLLITKLCT